MSKKVKVKKLPRTKAMTVGDLTAILSTMDPRLRILSANTFRDVFDLIPQADGETALIVERDYVSTLPKLKD